ncbi:hypothetical protein [Streptomyces sp. NBC_00696]|uniref:hypothetical protein n=1 Tax=Streptomyces sp. NBC_00696 TaxID=2903672 RepID=UPI002E359590|nr:hypothetical protein [Streptomyces sp. NBC_00696]
MSNPEWVAWIETKQRRETEAAAVRPRTDSDRAAAQADWNIWPEVVAQMEEDQDDAIDLYGVALCRFAVGQSDRLELTGNRV